MLDAFLELGPRYNAVARRAGCSPITAKSAWVDGFPSVPYGAPIARVYHEALSRVEAKKAESDAATKEKAHRVADSATHLVEPQLTKEMLSQEHVRQRTPAELLRDSALDALQSENDLLQAFRSNMVGAVLTANKMLVGLDALAGAAVQALQVQAQNPLLVTPGKVLDPLEKVARIFSLLVSSTKSVMEMQRLLVGAPQQITETRGGAEVAAEFTDKMRNAGRVFDMLRRNGYLPGASVAPEQTHFEETGPSPTARVVEVIEATEAVTDSSSGGATTGQSTDDIAAKAS